MTERSLFEPGLPHQRKEGIVGELTQRTNVPPERIQSYGKRTDGTPKGLGYFGEIPNGDNPENYSTELSIEANFGGKNVLLPLIVPTLTHSELTLITNRQASADPKNKAAVDQIYEKAMNFAAERMKAGKSPYAAPEEVMPLPKSEEESFTQGFQSR